jgi:hypothetical protein
VPQGQTILNTQIALHSSCSQANRADRYTPYTGLIEDACGDFYGTISVGEMHPATVAHVAALARCSNWKPLAITLSCTTFVPKPTAPMGAQKANIRSVNI